MTDETDRRARRRPLPDRWSRGRGAAVTRLAGGVVVPQGTGSFRLAPTSRVFCLGSAFARTLEAALGRSGARLASLPDGRRDTARDRAARLLDLDDPVSVRQCLDWAAGAPFPEEALLPEGDLWRDPFLPSGAEPLPLDGVRARRAGIAAQTARLFNADLALLVLGQAETWFDRRTRLALTGPPPRHAREADPGRFGVKRLSYDEAAVALKAACALIRRRRPEGKIVLAVSPLPLERTFTGDDIIVANMAGKSVLHAAATAMAARNEGVDYFPAYEAATASDPGHAWESDRRTLRPALVGRLADSFMRDYGLTLAPDSGTAGTA